MRLPNRVTNTGLAALIAGSGFTSLERFATAVNVRGWDDHRIKTSYDHVTVKRWLAGSVCHYPDVVAAVLGDAWGVTIPPSVIWPQLRDGRPPASAHLQPWVAERTLEQLGLFLRRDMLSRRETLAGAVTAVAGPALLAPIARWLGVPPGRLTARIADGERIGVAQVVPIERASRYLAATEAANGGGLIREGAVGVLKHAVDLAQHSSYTSAVGNRLLAAIAELSGLIGWLCHDCGLTGPAQRYFTFGLQAARESTEERAQLLVVTILADMAQQMRWLGRPSAALRLHDLALSQLPADRRRFTRVRAMLATKRAEDGLCHFGSRARAEMESSINLAFELHSQAGGDQRTATSPSWHRALDMSEAELHGQASAAFLVMARTDRRLATRAEEHTLHHIANHDQAKVRDGVLSKIRLARVRFALGEAEQACEDANTALALADPVASHMVKTRLHELVADSAPYSDQPAVQELRDRVHVALNP